MTPRPDNTEPEPMAFCAECCGMHRPGNGLCDLIRARKSDRERWGESAEELSRDYEAAHARLESAAFMLRPISRGPHMFDVPPTAGEIRYAVARARKALDAMLAIADTVEPKP